MLSTLAHRALERDGLGGIRDKVMAGQRLDEAEALRLLEVRDLAAIGALANHVRESRHGDLTFYNRNLHLNPTNVCVASCKFCSFARPDDKHASEGYTMSLDQAVEHVVSKRPLGITEVHMVSGLHPDLPWDYYLETVRRLRRAWPELHIKAYTAVELHFFAQKFGKSHEQVLRELHHAHRVLERRHAIGGRHDARRGGAAGDGDDVAVQLRRQPPVERDLALAAAAPPGQRAEVGEAEVDRLLDLVGERPGQQHPRQVRLDHLDRITGVGVAGRRPQRLDQRAAARRAAAVHRRRGQPIRNGGAR